MVQIIKTNIKFKKGLNNVANRVYGFVTKADGSWRGCNDTAEKKKIVFVDFSIAESIIPNLLYKCSLIPMNRGNGFIAQTAKLVQFPGTILTTCHKNIFIVKVKFGNRTFVYDPSSKKERTNNIQLIAENLKKRLDLKNAQLVAEDFINSACMVKRLYDQYHSDV